jgi:uncharacterized protein YndB with AHSA1/START domain
MTENTFNWKSFRHAIILDANLEEVFKYVSTAEGICRWFQGEASYRPAGGKDRPQNEIAASGDLFVWKWLAKDLILRGEVLDCQVNSMFQFTFGKSFEVVIRLDDHQGRTKLTLGHEYRPGVPEDQFQYLNCCVCWVFFLTNLKSVLEGGKDLREIHVFEEALINI